MVVNAAMSLKQSLLFKGELVTGRTEMTRYLASGFGLEMIKSNIKSNYQGVTKPLLICHRLTPVRQSTRHSRFSDIKNLY